MAVATKTNGRSALVEPTVDTNQFANGIGIQPGQTIMAIRLEGVAKMLFHRYDCASVESKGKAGKGTTAKKTDDIDSYVYRLDDGTLGIPAEVLEACLQVSAKSFQDPRSPRKSANELFKAGILVQPDMVPLTRLDGSVYESWDFLDTRRVTVMRAAISRTRPGIEAGWTLDANIQILLPELITPELLRKVLVNAGAVVGLCDFRPRFGRFQVTRAETVSLG